MNPIAVKKVVIDEKENTREAYNTFLKESGGTFMERLEYWATVRIGSILGEMIIKPYAFMRNMTGRSGE